jgi:hypothetical protein
LGVASNATSDAKVEFIERRALETDLIPSAILRSLEATYVSNGAVAQPKPQRIGSTLKSFEPRDWEALCPACRTRVASITVAYLDVNAAAPAGWDDHWDFDYESSNVAIGTKTLLESGFVNAKRRSSLRDARGLPWYRLSTRRPRTTRLRIATPAVVTCRCNCEFLVQFGTFDEYAGLSRDEREQHLREQIDAENARDVAEERSADWNGLRERLASRRRDRGRTVE